MTPQDHKKTLCLIYGLLGAVFGLLILISPWIIARNITEQPSARRADQIITATIIFSIVFLLTALLIITAYGLFKRKSWSRTPALILAALMIWIFPLGTALSVYTWWFMHSEGGKELYSKTQKSKSAV
jgi:cytochrome bd-type quinol oxidase subunit 2